MEDEAIVCSDLREQSDLAARVPSDAAIAVFAVFDGHAGTTKR
jgi:hypothetical protein